VAELGALVSVHTDEPLVAARAIAAGACILNGAGARHGGELAQLCAQTGAALVLLREHVEQALAIGVVREQLVLDPGPALARTPAEASFVLADVERLHALGAPLLVDLSRDELIGQPSAAPPRAGAAPMLAALATGLDAGAQLFRVTDVSAASDFLTVRAALSGELLPSRDLELPEELRYERSAVE